MMSNIKLKLQVPTQLSDITLGEYQDYMKVMKNIQKDHEEETTEESERFVHLKMLQIFCGVDLRESYKLPINVFSSVIEQINGVLDHPAPLVKAFLLEVNGEKREFGLIPDIYKMSFGEYVDLDMFINDWSTMHEAMAVLFRPILNKFDKYYEIEEYESSKKYSADFKRLSMDIVFGVLVFFYRLGMKLAKSIGISSLKNLKEMRQEDSNLEKRFLEKHGVGINQFTLSLEETFVHFLRLPNSHFKSV